MTTFELGDRILSHHQFCDLARSQTILSLNARSMNRVRDARALIEKAIEDRIPIYGVTTGLGSRAKEALPEESLSAFSVETLNGRAQSLGPALPRVVVRGAMIARLNTLLTGASGASPAVVEHLRDVLNADLVPVVRRFGSIGASDLLLGAEMGRAIMGMGGEITTADGEALLSAKALADAGITPPFLGPRDGLALANHGSFSTAATCLAWHTVLNVLSAATHVIALSMLGFQANPGPLDQLHDVEDRSCGKALSDLLSGQALTPRFIQDPISFRNAVQPIACANAAQKQLAFALVNELGNADDNPSVVPGSGDVVSTGNYFKLRLALECNSLAQALAVCGVSCVARISKHCNSEHSGLPNYLADPDVGTNGFAPLLKLAESLLAELQHAAVPPVISPSINANGIEDVPTHSFQSALLLDEAINRLSQLVALESVVAAQACDLRGIEVASNLGSTFNLVREHSPYLRESRPIAGEVELLATNFRESGMP